MRFQPASSSRSPGASETAVRYYNRYTGRMETESIFGEAFIRWAYETRLGHCALWTGVKRAWFSRLYGWWANRSFSSARVAPFISRYRMDLSDFAKAQHAYTSFNDFFSRRLRPGARAIDQDEQTVVFPADGRHLGFETASEVRSVFVKGQQFDLPSLLRNPRLAARYRDGTVVFSRLCPLDYHWFHFPVHGTPGEPCPIPGFLFSVNPIALRRRIDILWQNKRVMTRLDTEDFGEVILLEIGATNVGSIVQRFSPGRSVRKGDAKGLFRFGGSAVITLFEPGRLRLAGDLLDYSARGIEVYAKMGDPLGRLE